MKRFRPVLVFLFALGGCPTVPTNGNDGGGGLDDGGVDMVAKDGGGCGLRTCASANIGCGWIGDGCGGTVFCGDCPSSQVCGGGGVPFQCGGVGCVKKTCEDFGFNCGKASDGCDGIIDCGSCTGTDICGGGGPNRCGGGTNPDGGTCTNLCQQQVQCDGGSTTLTGVVLAPTNPALGYGDPDPLPNALVYVPNGTVQPFTSGVSCGACGAEVTGDPLVSTNSAVDGTFTLTNVPCGTDIPLVIQLGRWRRHIVIPNVACCENTALTAEQTRFPRRQGEGGDPLNNIPLIAITTGSADAIECVLPKIGIDVSEFSNAAGTGRVRFYHDNGATTVNGKTMTEASTLWGSPTELAKYDAVIFDCVGKQQDKTDTQLANVKQYGDAGGRIFASHFSYVWLYDNDPWGCGDGCTTSGHTTANWKLNQSNPGDLTAFIDQSFPKGAQFATWLQGVGASTTLGRIPVSTVRHNSDGIISPGQRWMYADPDVSPNNPLEYTFNTPVGVAAENQCGRVLYSDFHVYNRGGSDFPSECKKAPMTPQEKVLEFQIFDLTSCVTPDVPSCTPRTCEQQNADCGYVGDGCGDVVKCGDCPQGQTCVSGKCGSLCNPISCEQAGAQCGAIGDGCGGIVECGSCGPYYTCGAPGSPNICIPIPG